MAIFIDTNIFVAFYNEADENHSKAKKIITDIAEGKYGKALTSDYVFDEAVTVILARTKDLAKAVDMGEYIMHAVPIATVTKALLQYAWDIFRNENAQKMSFTDCTNRAFVQRLGIKKIATLDGAFRKAEGIEVIDG